MVICVRRSNRNFLCKLPSSLFMIDSLKTIRKSRKKILPEFLCHFTMTAFVFFWWQREFFLSCAPNILIQKKKPHSFSAKLERFFFHHTFSTLFWICRLSNTKTRKKYSQLCCAVLSLRSYVLGFFRDFFCAFFFSPLQEKKNVYPYSLRYDFLKNKIFH